MNGEPVDMESMLHAFRKGEEIAFDYFFRQYFSSLSLFAYKLINDEQESEDIVQDCFVQLWKKRKSLQHIDAVKSYLYTAVKNRCMDAIRKRKSLSASSGISEWIADGEPNVEALVVMAETVREIQLLIDLLPPRMQQVFKLYYLEGKTYQEIGQMMETDPETVRNQRFKALQVIRKTFIPG